ncbi:MAG: 5-formyltetrahydrofolate cyclo-ligase [Nitriliruptor sp.]|uniref:5-formyltetrahydrofolate cyclo-ligase n=1 Tax=Nitriliruptor sp. TaxID=2448056 RepID=UPI0034A001C0
MSSRTPGDHARDAGGDPELLARKAELRTQVWDRLEAAGVTRFPGARHRISNFVGAEAAAERLRDTDVWRAATTVKANPDSPQWPVRQRALEDGKTVYMAVPRLAGQDPFFLLDPDHLADTPRRASSIKGASASAHTVAVEDLEPVDLVVTGCVAVTEDGLRLGKGGGFADLEFALASEAGMIDDRTVVVTTVHEVQVLPAGAVPASDHDVRLDLIVTPERVIEVPRRGPRPPGRIRWGQLTADKIAAIPLLARLEARGLPSRTPRRSTRDRHRT